MLINAATFWSCLALLLAGQDCNFIDTSVADMKQHKETITPIPIYNLNGYLWHPCIICVDEGDVFLMESNLGLNGEHLQPKMSYCLNKNDLIEAKNNKSTTTYTVYYTSRHACKNPQFMRSYSIGDGKRVNITTSIITIIIIIT